MKESLILAAVFVCAFCTTGCFPYRYTSRPSVTGVVVDTSGSPVSSADVALYWGGDDAFPLTPSTAPEIREITTSDGRFALPPEHKWNFGLLAYHDLPMPWRVCARRAGYEPVQIDIELYPVNDKTKDVGRISMHRSPATSP